MNTEFSFLITDDSGSLAAITEKIGMNEIDIQAFMTVSQEEHAIAKIVPDDATKLQNLVDIDLHNIVENVQTRDVYYVDVPFNPNKLSEILNLLRTHKPPVNLESLYVLPSDPEYGRIVISSKQANGADLEAVLISWIEETATEYTFELMNDSGSLAEIMSAVANANIEILGIAATTCSSADAIGKLVTNNDVSMDIELRKNKMSFTKRTCFLISIDHRPGILSQLLNITSGIDLSSLYLSATGGLEDTLLLTLEEGISERTVVSALS